MNSRQKYAVEMRDLDRLIAAGGGKLTFKTYSEAVSWRNRVYRFRKLLLTEDPEEARHYSRLTISINGPEVTCVIRSGYKMTDLEGNEIITTDMKAPIGPRTVDFEKVAKGMEKEK